MTTKPTTLATVNNDPRVDSAYRDSDGVWIELKYGWANLCDEPNGGLHGIHEDTARDALRKFRGVGMCDCADCVEGMHKTALADLKRTADAFNARLDSASLVELVTAFDYYTAVRKI